MDELKKIFDFLHLMADLKETIRYKSSASSKRPRPESVAEHSWRVALMTIVFAQHLNLKIDVLRAVKMAIVHDIVEAITDDIDWVEIAAGRISFVQKQKGEYKALSKICASLPNALADEIFCLWDEFEQGRTPEARFVAGMDKTEALFHLDEIGAEFFDKKEFIPTYADKILAECPEISQIVRMVMGSIILQREKFEAAQERA